MSGHFANMRHGMAASLLMVTMATAASAQSVTDPTRVEFAPSNAPNALDVRTGTPLVEKYTLDIYRAGSGTVVQSVDLGNPSPDPDGTIRVNFVALLPAPLPAGVVYEGIVNVVGPVETVSSIRSETFAFSTACTPALSPTSSVLTTWSATTGSIAVAANTSCSWTATSNATWLTITANAYGTGNGTVSYSVAANTATTSRTGTMTIGGQTFSVSQAGTPACTFTISPAISTLSSSGAATGTVAVTAGTSCSWTATSNAAWITITGGADGTGNGAVTYNVAANTGAAPRTGTVTIGGQSFSVTQPGTSCVSGISPTSSTLTGSIGASGAVTVTAPAGCSWTATSNDAWITVGSGATGTGNGMVSYNVAANTSSGSRTGTLTIGGSLFTITQPGAACVFTLSPFSSTLTSPAAADGTVTVSSAGGCNWTAASNASWITITSGASGSGTGTVNYSVASNPGTTSRTGTMTIAGKTFSVTQPATSCVFTISPTSQMFPTGGGNGTVTVTTSAGCNWTASSSAAWVTISGGATGTGSGTVGFNVAANTSALSRAATLTIAGKSFTVTESGPSCTFSLTPSLITAPPTGTSGSITVTTQPTCAWTATTTSAWVTVSGSGMGSGTATYTVQPNTGTIARSGLVNIGGVFVGVSQPAPTAPPSPNQ